MEDEISDGVHNLYDCYVNTTLLYRSMLTSKIDVPVEVLEKLVQGSLTEDERGVLIKYWTVSDRSRFERMWWSGLYVLIEAWRARLRPTGDGNKLTTFFESLTSFKQLQEVIDHLQHSGVIAKLQSCRHYMCHRDRREIWDEGRMSASGHMKDLQNLNDVFGAVFREAILGL